MGSATRYVAVDYGGVLTNSMATSFTKFTEATGLTQMDVQRALHDAATPGDTTIMAALERGEVTEADAFGRIVTQLPTGAGKTLVDPLTLRRMWLAGRTANADMIAAVTRVRESFGVPLALASNNVREWESHWRQIIGELSFDVEVVSCNLGARKPEAGFYRHLVGATGCAPNDIFFVDDAPENVSAAREHGVRAVVYSGVEDFERDVRAWLALDSGVHRAG